MTGIDLELDSEQALLRDTVRDFVAREVAPLAAERDRDAAFPESELRAAAELGLCGLMIDEDYGGNPVGTLGAALVYEEVAKASPAVSVTLSVHNSLVSTAIGRYGSPELKQAYLPRLASGEILGAYALTEPGSGSDAASISTTAGAVDGGYRLNGRKVFVTNGGHAGAYVVFAVTDPAARTSKRISAFLVDRDSEGLSVPRKERKLGLRASEIVELTFTDCFVPSEH
ncbi:MAG TPA: acyl-CoA dehydrogenase family protein, partial [Thermomicrobiaceae bacterium]|nr:acyl-CoA dehydrogenase family protein [Thermomicrobiaceae bacterium]